MGTDYESSLNKMCKCRKKQSLGILCYNVYGYLFFINNTFHAIVGIDCEDWVLLCAGCTILSSCGCGLKYIFQTNPTAKSIIQILEIFVQPSQNRNKKEIHYIMYQELYRMCWLNIFPCYKLFKFFFYLNLPIKHKTK